MSIATKLRTATKSEQAARLFAERVAEAIPEVRSVVLYGSVARQSATRGSDVDVLLLVDDSVERLQTPVFDLALAFLDEEPGAIMAPILYTTDEFAAMLRGGYPYAKHIIEDGIPLKDDGAYASLCAEAAALLSSWSERMSDPDNKFIRSKIDRAEQMLSDAQIMLRARRYLTAADRGYYCMFLSAEAALALVGVEPPKSHDGVIGLFGTHVAKKGLLPRRYQSELTRGKSVREDSTYGGEKAAGERQAAHIVEVAERLLADVKRLAEEKRK